MTITFCVFESTIEQPVHSIIISSSAKQFKSMMLHVLHNEI